MKAAKACSVCGASFSCACNAGSCWCADYPAVMPVDFTRDCRCPACLAKEIGRRIEQQIAGLPHAEALRLARSQAHGQQLIEDIDYTVEDGRLVFTKWYLLKQGNCCGNGCRNCPYPATAFLHPPGPASTPPDNESTPPHVRP